MNVLISVNENYLDKAKTMLYSLALHNKEELVVYFLNHSLSKEMVNEFRVYLKNVCNTTLIEINVKNTELDNMPLGELHFSIEMYYRVLAQFILPKKLDRILWLDADIIILKDLYHFYHQDFDGKYYVVCANRNYDSNSISDIKEKVGIDQKHIYFNSGVMLMNLEQLRVKTSKDIIISTSNTLKKKLTYPDQDILNYLYCKNVKYADLVTFNYQVKDDDSIPAEMMQKIAILHYCGSSKPWLYSDIKRSSLSYWQVRYRQGYKNEAKNIYKNLIMDCLHRLVGLIKDYFQLRKIND